MNVDIQKSIFSSNYIKTFNLWICHDTWLNRFAEIGSCPLVSPTKSNNIHYAVSRPFENRCQFKLANTVDDHPGLNSDNQPTELDIRNFLVVNILYHSTE
ncbi:hypothetical protein DICVIV_14171 [Dictyocaulus viviparus]|uniref:Uncharacterized protein n=1 Tax=Dictyocaulus viviparus TaxID=29172 RepID=A0A0D8X8F6_DICVI|nr:hypothetical protein DICVIV_14171 [Dictyocaulus viviparus]